LQADGFRLGCITNNVPSGHGAGMASSAIRADAVAAVLARFEVVIESSKVGLRKPDPAIYLMACQMLGVTPDQCVYLDDLGINCKPAATLGMHAIKVTGEAQALADLAAVLGKEPGWV
jgi:putative hydrolase of the HAD superfamily